MPEGEDRGQGDVQLLGEELRPGGGVDHVSFPLLQKNTGQAGILQQLHQLGGLRLGDGVAPQDPLLGKAVLPV